jgi:hypothetical protein
MAHLRKTRVVIVHVKKCPELVHEVIFLSVRLEAPIAQPNDGAVRRVVPSAWKQISRMSASKLSVWVRFQSCRRSRLLAKERKARVQPATSSQKQIGLITRELGQRHTPALGLVRAAVNTLLAACPTPSTAREHRWLALAGTSGLARAGRADPHIVGARRRGLDACLRAGLRRSASRGVGRNVSEQSVSLRAKTPRVSARRQIGVEVGLQGHFGGVNNVEIARLGLDGRSQLGAQKVVHALCVHLCQVQVICGGLLQGLLRRISCRPGGEATRCARSAGRARGGAWRDRVPRRHAEDGEAVQELTHLHRRR